MGMLAMQFTDCPGQGRFTGRRPRRMLCIHGLNTPVTALRTISTVIWHHINHLSLLSAPAEGWALLVGKPITTISLRARDRQSTRRNSFETWDHYIRGEFRHHRICSPPRPWHWLRSFGRLFHFRISKMLGPLLYSKMSFN